MGDQTEADIRADIERAKADLVRANGSLDEARAALDEARALRNAAKSRLQSLEDDLIAAIDAGQPTVSIGDEEWTYVRHSAGWKSIWLRRPGTAAEVRFRSVSYPPGVYQASRRPGRQYHFLDHFLGPRKAARLKTEVEDAP